MIRVKQEGKRRRYKTSVTIGDFYKFYKTKSKSTVDKEIFKKIVNEFNESICRACIYENLFFNMPYRLGVLSIKKKKSKAYINSDGSLNTKYLAVDWNATKELWKNDSEAKEKHQKVFHLNRNTKGFICRWHWDRYNINLSNRTYYHLDIMRKYDRELAKVLNDPESNVDFYDRKIKT